MTLVDLPLLALLALLFELVVGYPQSLFARIGHPVTWIGTVIAALDRRWNRPAMSEQMRRALGVAALLVLVAGSVAVAGLIEALAGRSLIGFLVMAVLASSLIAQRSLDLHVAAVATGLRSSLEDGRRAVSRIVGRNPDVLDEAGIARAAIESLAENFSDGVVAPLFWTAVLGLPGGLAYKAVNTADSMIGHKTPRHLAFGWASARFDDIVNVPASRLSAGLLIAAAALVPGASAGRAMHTVGRDAERHRSPNAGWPEAAMAGALGLSLAGPRVYGDELVDDATMGNGRREATAADIDRALRLYRTALAIEALLLVVVVVMASALLG